MANVNSRIKQTVQALGVTAVTGSAPQTVTGNTVVMANVETGTLSANVYAKATVNNLTLTAKWQVSDDNSTFRDCKLPNNAANVVMVTGTGSAVTDTLCLEAPACVYGKRYARLIVVSGAASGSGLGSDEANVSYNYRVAQW